MCGNDHSVVLSALVDEVGIHHLYSLYGHHIQQTGSQQSKAANPIQSNPFCRPVPVWEYNMVSRDRFRLSRPASARSISAPRVRVNRPSRKPQPSELKIYDSIASRSPLPPPASIWYPSTGVLFQRENSSKFGSHASFHTSGKTVHQL